MERRITVTMHDYQRIMGMLEGGTSARMPEVASQLYRKLVTAHAIASETIERKVVTMNSRVVIRQIDSNREMELCITYPQDADPKAKKVSVLSSIGTALLGREEKDLVSWNIPGGVGVFEIVKVTYQPEAAGDFHL